MAKSSNNSDEDGNTIENGHFIRTEKSYTHNTKRRRFRKPRSDLSVSTLEEIFKPTDQDCRIKPCRRSERRIIPNSLWDNAVINPFYERKRRKVDNLSKVQEQRENIQIHEAENKKVKRVENDNGTFEKTNGETIINGEDTNGDLDDNFEIGHVRLRRSSRKLSSSVSNLSDTKNPLKQDRLKKRHYSSENSSENPKPNAEVTVTASEETNGISSECSDSKSPDITNNKPLAVEEDNFKPSECTNSQNGTALDSVTIKEEERSLHVLPRRRRRYGRIPNHLKEFYQIPVKKERNCNEKSSNESDDIVINSKEALSLIDGTNFHRFYQMRTRRQNSSTDENNGKFHIL